MTTDPHGAARGPAEPSPGAGPIATDEAFSEYFTKHFERFVAWARKEYSHVGRDRQTAEEIVTDAFHKLYEDRARIPSNPDSALMARIRTEALDRDRKNKRSRDASDLLDRIDPSARAADSVLGSQECREMFSEEAVATLRGDDRRLYDLYLDDKSYKDIAEITGMPYKTVEWRFREIVAKLFEAMSKMMTIETAQPPVSPKSVTITPIGTPDSARKAIGRLPQRLGAIATLTYIDLVPPEQIAIRLKYASADEVSMHLGRAHELLAKLYRVKMPDALIAALKNERRKSK